MPTPRKKPEDKKQVGRPLEYNKEMGDYICELVASTGHGLLRLTRLYPELPDKTTINRWRYRNEEFRTQYAQAKLEQADILAEECLEIADDSAHDVAYDKDGNVMCNSEFIARSRLRIDTRKWLASKLLPKQYGDKSLGENNKMESIVEKLLNKVVE